MNVNGNNNRKIIILINNGTENKHNVNNGKKKL